MTNVRSSVLLLSVFLLMAGTVLAQDPGNRDTVRVAKVTTNAGQKVGVPVTIYNDETLGGYSLGIKWNWDAVKFDSISYIGTRLSKDLVKKKAIDATLQGVLVGMYSTDLTVDSLEPGDGLVFTIWCTVAPGVPDQYVSLDSTYIPPAGPFMFSTASGDRISPEFIKGEIKIGNPQPSPIIVLSKSAFVFAGVSGGTNPTSQVQHISNGGGQTLNWTATKLASWLVLTPSNGLAPSDMVVAVNTVGLSAGTYSDSVSVSAPGATNTPQKFAVTLTLAIPPPTIQLTPSSLHFQAQLGGANPPGKTLNITNTSQGTLNWTATKKSAWLTLSSYGGTAPSSVTINVDNTGLLAGVYVDSIRISDPTATNNPQYDVVTFEIFSEFPVIVPSPTSIYAIGSGTQNPYLRTLLIQNNGGGVMNWHVAAEGKLPWMSFDHDSGTASQGSPGEVIVSFDGAGLSFGEHHNTITITSTNAINSPVGVPVVFSKVENPKTLIVSDSIVSFSEYECGSYPGVGPDSFIVNPGVGQPPLEWTLTDEASWLTVSPTSGNENTTVNLRVSAAGLAPGIYFYIIFIRSEVAINPEKRVLVTFTVLPTPSARQIGLTKDSLFYLFRYTAVSSVDQDVMIYSIPGGCVDWQATSNASWLTPIPASGTTTQTVKIRSNAVGLSLGRHEGKVTFTASGAVPREVKVALWVYAFGDANGDGIVDISDVVYLLAYIFLGGQEPIPVIWSGDVDCSQIIDISDVVWLLMYIFGGGQAPCIW
jgi:hypothetical protein